jgi:hypothetical protein
LKKKPTSSGGGTCNAAYFLDGAACVRKNKTAWSEQAV